MGLFMVEDYSGWGYSFSVVRAADQLEALRAVKPNTEAGRLSAMVGDGRIKVIELREGNGILWTWDHSPDTPRED